MGGHGPNVVGDPGLSTSIDSRGWTNMVLEVSFLLVLQ